MFSQAAPSAIHPAAHRGSIAARGPLDGRATRAAGDRPRRTARAERCRPTVRSSPPTTTSSMKRVARVGRLGAGQVRSARAGRSGVTPLLLPAARVQHSVDVEVIAAGRTRLTEQDAAHRHRRVGAAGRRPRRRVAARSTPSGRSRSSTPPTGRRRRSAPMICRARRTRSSPETADRSADSSSGASPWKRGRAGSRSKRSTSSIPPSAVAITTGSRRRRASRRMRTFVANESHSSTTTSDAVEESSDVGRADAFGNHLDASGTDRSPRPCARPARPWADRDPTSTRAGDCSSIRPACPGRPA